MLKKGYVQVYTGDGKGKTSASLGLCLRALACGLRVFYAQFIKNGKSSEFKVLGAASPAFTHRAFGYGRFIKGKPSAKDYEFASAGLQECREAVSSGKYDVVVMDEANGAVKAGLFTADNVLEVIKAKHQKVELIITGRNAAPEIISAADLVTEMNVIKHYMAKGVKARKGIEF